MTRSRRGRGAGRLPLHAALFLVAALLIGIAAWRLGMGPVPGGGFVVADVPVGGAPRFSADVAGRAPEGAYAHAPSIIETKPGELLAVWYQGSREGAHDVRLLAARQVDGAWQPPEVVASPQQSAADLHRAIRTIGNPVLMRRGANEIWLVYVTTSVGGWATSALNLRRSHDGGRTWGPARRLVATPFFNISTLVKAPPFAFADGFAAIPAYEEMAAKLPELLILDANGTVIDRRRMGGTGRIAIQPFVAPLDATHAIALMRPGGGWRDRRVHMSATADGGRTWSAIRATDLPNPDGPDAVLRLAPDLMLLVFNDNPADERDMSLAISRDQGGTWKVVDALDRNKPGEVPSLTYPSAMVDSAGMIQVVYVDRRDMSVRHVAFNRAWFEARAKAAQ
jgi:predicted neuraminidase